MSYIIRNVFGYTYDVIKDTMDKTQGIIITHALNDNETLISGLTGGWQHPLNLKFELSFLTEKHKCTLFECLSFTMFMLFPSQQKDMCGERAISEQHNGKPIQIRELENKNTPTLPLSCF